MPKTAKNGTFSFFLEKKCRKNLPVSKMAVILQRFSTEISSSGLGRRPLTAETRVRVPVSLPNEAFIQSRVRALFFISVFLEFLAKVKEATTVGGSGAEDVAVATIGKVQALTQLLGSHREVAHGDVSAGNTSHRSRQFFLVH